jgi:hypothetical protein
MEQGQEAIEMSRAFIELLFDNRSEVDDRQYMKVTVDDRTPETLEHCLVIRRGDAMTDERLVEVAEYSRIFISPYPVLSTPLDRFDTSHGLAVDDVVKVKLPPMWSYFLGMSGTFNTTVLENVGGQYRVGTPFPTFARNVQFTVNEAPEEYGDGLCTRVYPVIGDTYYRVNSHVDMHTSIQEVQSLFLALQSQAQSLVNDVNRDRWSGTFRRRFT